MCAGIPCFDSSFFPEGPRSYRPGQQTPDRLVVFRWFGPMRRLFRRPWKRSMTAFRSSQGGNALAVRNVDSILKEWNIFWLDRGDLSTNRSGQGPASRSLCGLRAFSLTRGVFGPTQFSYHGKPSFPRLPEWWIFTHLQQWACTESSSRGDGLGVHADQCLPIPGMPGRCIHELKAMIAGKPKTRCCLSLMILRCFKRLVLAESSHRRRRTWGLTLLSVPAYFSNCFAVRMPERFRPLVYDLHLPAGFWCYNEG